MDPDSKNASHVDILLKQLPKRILSVSALQFVCYEFLESKFKESINGIVESMLTRPFQTLEDYKNVVEEVQERAQTLISTLQFRSEGNQYFPTMVGKVQLKEELQARLARMILVEVGATIALADKFK